ncbi:hypothetical protein MYSTI_06313 [Myxococcus stipitatus DSM 14675]|uniref:DUF3006 domain-containing protein n=1 Tax=Myxococcus stipitatus (strain DSM 14675 / JCM 12634 / Mx s8) TaxID=1278073 RepID=L7UF83_MYXSD|nr:DUF3006 domain-containing protein [Myxococcus stipitatus]AGC47586.1 hypothetical protein MYSTI_06313 [Myxococcus stipitatus DSM 14675]
MTKHTQAPQQATLDRIEDDVAVLVVDGREVTKPLASLPSGVREGDVLDLETLTVNPEATEMLRGQVRAARQRAKKGKTPPPGDFDL